MLKEIKGTYEKFQSPVAITLMLIFIFTAWCLIYVIMDKISIINEEKGNLIVIRRGIDADITESLAEENTYLESIKNDPALLKKHIKGLGKTTHVRHRFGMNKEKAYQYLISHYLVDGDLDKCVEDSKYLVNFNENNYQNHVLHGDCLVLAEEKAKAFNAYENAWEIYPISFDLNQKLISMYESDGFDINPGYIKEVYATYPRPKESLQFYFASKGGEFDGEHYIILDGIDTNIPSKTYRINLSDIKNWGDADFITSLRVDPVQFKSDGLIVGMQSMVFKKKGGPDLVIKDFSKWGTSPNMKRTDERHFRIIGNDPYLLLENSFSIPSDYEELHITLDFNIDI